VRKDGKDLDAIFKRIASEGGGRLATCGACGAERPVTPRLRKHLYAQFTPRPKEPTDSFYCGCEDHEDDLPWGWG
jgi:hypothetical protein